MVGLPLLSPWCVHGSITTTSHTDTLYRWADWWMLAVWPPPSCRHGNVSLILDVFLVLSLLLSFVWLFVRLFVLCLLFPWGILILKGDCFLLANWGGTPASKVCHKTATLLSHWGPNLFPDLVLEVSRAFQLIAELWLHYWFFLCVLLILNNPLRHFNKPGKTNM